MRIAVVDDHHLIISSIESIVEKIGYMQFVGKYRNGSTLKKELAAIRPDILILDYNLPNETGTELAKFVLAQQPKIKILILTGYERPGLTHEILKSGCAGYLLKSTGDTKNIIEALNTIYDGRIYMDSNVITYNRGTENEPTQTYLTRREIEILRYIVAEHSNSEIAEKLFISKRTVDNHRNNLMIKSGSKNIVGLIKFALEQNII